uniref:Myosin-Va n=1 Tax=Ascaris suum TaxID=6253 RepID=F1KWT5_ASCSU
MNFLHDVLLGDQQETKNIRSTIKSLVGGAKKATKKCVSFQFRDSLNELMTVLGNTRPHYVRCIKPNDEKLSFTFEPKRAIQQLRACGVLETVRISAAGYPSRWSYEDFGRRYRVLHPDGKALWRNNPKQFAEKACQRHMEEGMFALGKTKVFFRTGQVALLERLRQETLSVSAVVIQKTWKGFVARRRYQLIRQSILTIQAATRAYLIYTRMKYLQMHRAVVCIQTAYRRYIARKKYLMLKAAIVMIQSHFRGALIRRKIEKLRYEQKAIVIQKYFRGWLVRREQIERTRKIIKVQCLVRRWLAKRRLKELKIEARSVGHLQKLNKGLENKIISLQQRLDIMSAENSRLVEVCHNNEKMRSQLAILESERPTLASAKARVDELELEVERLETECDVRDAQIGELETRIQQTHTKMEQKDAEAEQKLRSMKDELTALCSKYDDLMKQKKALQSELAIESEKRMSAEQEISQMRDQLLANANLLASPGLSRIGSMRASQRNLSDLQSASHLSLAGPEGQSVSLGAASGDLEQVALILKQQQMINDLRTKLEQHQRENDRLKAIMDANSMIESLDKRTSMRAFEVQRVQELELAYSKLKMELDRLIEEKAGNGFEGMNFRSLFEKTLEENDRRREESAELRAILASRFERHSLNILSPLPDSGHWSLAHSDDDASLSDLDEELCLERQCRQLKVHIETLTRAITERNQEIEQLENRLNESFPLTKPASDENRPVEETITNIHRQLNHLVSENLSLQSKLNRQADELTEARAQLRGYSGALGFSLDNASDSEIIRLEALTKESVEHY